MKREQQLAFEYGKAASLYVCPFAPCYDTNMHRLIGKAKSDSDQRRNQENIQAWYEGYLSQTASNGEGISFKQFALTLLMLTDSEPETISCWITFAKECVACGQFVDFAEEGAQMRPVNLWLETLMAGFFDIHKRFGKHIVTQVCDLALQPNCLYPSEMQQAVKHFQAGGSPSDITKMIENGKLEGCKSFFPKLSLRDINNSPCVSNDGQILGM